MMTHDEIIEKIRRREIRLVICDGDVTSINDRDRHYIGPLKLLQLYNVPRNVPFVVYPSRGDEFHGWCGLSNDLILRPLRNGDYSLEKAYVRMVDE